MDPAQTPDIASFGEYKKVPLLNQSRDLVIDKWLKMVRASLEIPLSDADLDKWLNAYFIAFCEQINNPSGSPTGKVFSDFASELQKQGSSLSDVMEIIILLSQVLKSFELSQSTPVSSFIISSQVLHVMAHNADDFIDRTVKENLRQQERTATLLRVAKAASSSLDLEHVVRTISNEIVQALDARYCNSFLFPNHSKYGNYFLLDPDSLSGYSVPDPPEPFGVDALLSQEPVICYDAALDPRTDKETVRFFGLKSLMAFPLVFNGKSIAAGLIVMKDYHHFTQEEIDLVMGIANATAIAIENAQMFEKTKQIAIIEERNRISTEMHDNLAQALAIIKMNASNLLHEGLSASERETLQEIKDLANETYIDLRDTIFGLHAINESDVHFLDNFKNYLAVFGVHSGLEIQFDVPETHLNLLSNEAVLQLGRILEEALKNVRKHARAKHVWIKSCIEKSAVWITVEDDGAGIDPKYLMGPDDGHFGLRIMRERAGSVGGKFAIRNGVRGGVCVSLDFPIRK